jgi:hypothetical protein
VAAFALCGLGLSLVVFGLYYYQDERYFVPWMPLWLWLAAGGATWPLRWRGGPAVRWVATGVVGVFAVAAVGPAGTAVVRESAAWRRVVEREVAVVPPRLGQAETLARSTPADAWLVSAMDGPFVDFYAVRGTARRYVPLALGLEFVDKPPFRSVQTAGELREAVAARLAAGATSGTGAAGGESGTPGRAVVLDRWSLEFAEGLPDFRTEMDRALATFDLVPAGPGAPLDPAYYLLAVAQPDHHLAAFDLRDGQVLRGSGEALYLYEGGARRHVRSLEAFTARGLRWQDVRRLPDVVLAAIPEEAAIG